MSSTYSDIDGPTMYIILVMVIFNSVMHKTSLWHSYFLEDNAQINNADMDVEIMVLDKVWNEQW
jgi:hypothetical protein